MALVCADVDKFTGSSRHFGESAITETPRRVREEPLVRKGIPSQILLVVDRLRMRGISVKQIVTRLIVLSSLIAVLLLSYTATASAHEASSHVQQATQSCSWINRGSKGNSSNWYSDSITFWQNSCNKGVYAHFCAEYQGTRNYVFYGDGYVLDQSSFTNYKNDQCYNTVTYYNDRTYRAQLYNTEGGLDVDFSINS